MMRTTNGTSARKIQWCCTKNPELLTQNQVNILLMVNVHTRLDSPTLKAHVTHKTCNLVYINRAIPDGARGAPNDAIMTS